MISPPMMAPGTEVRPPRITTGNARNATVALRALPVVILGGLTSVPGAIIGGLIIGVGEKLSEVYIGPLVGGGIEIWFAYVLALGFLLIRPQGLFGEKIIDRV
jgi:branched-chain amino acid transport system permease protein